MDIREESQKRALQILNRIYNSNISVRWKDTQTHAILRNNSESAYNRVKIYMLENLLHGLVQLVLGETSQLETILEDIASSRGDGTYFVRSVLFETKHKKSESSKNKTNSTNNLRFIGPDSVYVTKSHIFGSMIYTKHNFGKESKEITNIDGAFNISHVEDSRAIILLNNILDLGQGGTLHNVYNIDANLCYEYVDTNALMVMSYALSKHLDHAENHLKRMDRFKSVDGRMYIDDSEIGNPKTSTYACIFPNSLVRLAQLMIGDNSETSEFIDVVETQNPKGMPLQPYFSTNDYHIKQYLEDMRSPDINATASYALLLNFIGDKRGAFDRLESLFNTMQQENSVVSSDSINNTIESQPLLYLALAYADLSRQKSFFETGIIKS